jgi:hypothetical protein
MRYIIVALAASLCALAGLAIPTGLNTMPTADTLNLGGVRADVRYNSGLLYAKGETLIGGVQAGAPLGLEAGIDQVGDTQVLNAKWRFFGGGLFPGLAVGAQNIAKDETPQLYLVATQHVPVPMVRADASLGVLRDTDEKFVTMLGARLGYGAFDLKVDHVWKSASDGDLNATNVGVDMKLFRFFSVGAAVYGIENDEPTVGANVGVQFDLLPVL